MRNPQAAVILLALGSIACTSDVLRETYPTAEAARAAGLFARGWVPDVLPSGSGPIIEVHNLDTNQHCSRSQVPPLAVPEVVAALETAGFARYSGSVSAPPLRACPFESSDTEGVTSLFRRSRSAGRGVEYAAVLRSGSVYTWSD